MYMREMVEFIFEWDTPVKWFYEISQGEQIYTPVGFPEPTGPR
jgi:hypothetical protein